MARLRKPALDFSRLLVVHDLIRAGLADIDDRQPFEVPGLDLGGSRWASRAAPRMAWTSGGAGPWGGAGQM